jgi:hypothetical protein
MGALQPASINSAAAINPVLIVIFAILIVISTGYQRKLRILARKKPGARLPGLHEEKIIQPGFVGGAVW